MDEMEMEWRLVTVDAKKKKTEFDLFISWRLLIWKKRTCSDLFDSNKFEFFSVHHSTELDILKSTTFAFICLFIINITERIEKIEEFFSKPT